MSEPKKAAAVPGRAGLYIGLGAGGAVLLSCCICGVGGGAGFYFWPRSNELIGKWESSGHHVMGIPSRIETEFVSVNKGSQQITPLRPERPNQVIRTRFNYVLTPGKPGRLEMEPTWVEIGGRELPKAMIGRKEQYEIEINGNEMMLAHVNNPIGRIETKYRRVP